MSGQKNIAVHAVANAALVAAVARQRERERAAADLAQSRLQAQQDLGHLRTTMDETLQQSRNLAQQLQASQRELSACAAAIRDHQARSAQLDHDIQQTIAQAGAATEETRRAANEAQRELARLEETQRLAAATVQQLAAEQRAFDKNVLAPARLALDAATVVMQETEKQAATNLAVLAAMESDRTLGVLINSIVDESASAGLTLTHAICDQSWELRFRDAQGRLFNLAAAKKQELASLETDKRLALLIGESPTGDDACLLSVHQLLDRLRKAGIAATVHVSDSGNTGIAGGGGDRERA